MEKKAIPWSSLSKIVNNPVTRFMGKPVPRTMLGGAAGGAFGYHVTPRMFGYSDVPEARRSSAVLDAILGGVLAGAGGKNLRKLMAPSGGATTWKEVGRRTAPVTAFLGGESVPILQSSIHKQREAAEDISGAADRISQAVTAPGLLQRIATSNTARGAAMGIPAAGVAAILTGLLRRRTDPETAQRSTRSRMVTRDFLRHLIPAMVAGGVIGSLKQPRS